MEKKMKSVLHIACESYLISILNSDNPPPDGDINYFLKENGIIFTADSFTVISVNLKFTDRFYETYSNDEYLSLIKNISETFRSSIPEEYISFSLNPKKDDLVIIVNMTDRWERFDEVVGAVSGVLSLFEKDKEWISIKIGVGCAGSGYEGMRRSYNQSQNVNAMQMAGDKNSLAVFNAVSANENYVRYTIGDENKLYNLIMRKDLAGVKNFIEELSVENMRSGIVSQGIKAFYRYLYNTALRAIEAKGLENFTDGKYGDLENVINTNDENHIAEYVIGFLYEAASRSAAANEENKADEIIEYIGLHFAEGIYLEGVAGEFNISSKLLSKMVKNQTGISFGEYLSRLRIEEAKRLLTTTDMPINDIIPATGFISRNTFIRTFRKLTNVLPSDYRSNFSK
jgi:AraC-like DNA-binding protein